ncbi:MAG: hypothetical protein U1F40_09980 [Turneriella sp.]
MVNEFKKGIIRGIATLLVVGGGLFAFQVSGTIKTWTTGETLTASDLNTTVQSLKTAVEGATQVVQVQAPYRYGMAGGEVFSSLLEGFQANGSDTSTEPQVPMLRGGTIKSARLDTFKSEPNACTVTLRKNGLNTAIEFSVPANSTTAVTDSDTVTFVAGDVLTWRSYCGASGLNGFKSVISFEF